MLYKPYEPSALPMTRSLCEGLLEQRQELAAQMQQRGLGVIPFSAILEIEDPAPGDKVKPFLSHLIRLGVHPFDDRGLAWVDTGTSRRVQWWQLFEQDPDGDGYRWCIPPGRWAHHG